MVDLIKCLVSIIVTLEILLSQLKTSVHTQNHVRRPNQDEFIVTVKV